MPASKCGLPALSIHNMTPWNSEIRDDTRELGILFTGYSEKNKTDDIVFLCMNMHWEERDFILPNLPVKHEWIFSLATSDECSFAKVKNTVHMIGRSVAVFVARVL